MPAAPLILGPALGAALSGASAGIAGLTTSAIIASAVLGAVAGLIPIIAQKLLEKDAPNLQETATVRTEDLQITTYTRTGPIPIVYGFRRVGTNALQLAGLEFRDVTVTSTGRNESHLFGKILLGIAEGVCQSAVNFFIEDTPQPPGTWRFQQGTEDDIRAPEMDDSVPPGRNYRYPFIAKIFFSGDFGFVNTVPNFQVDLRGIYPNVIRSSGYGATFKPLRATLDGPTNTVVIIPDPSSVGLPSGVITYRLPYENQQPTVLHTQPPIVLGNNVSILAAFYFGLIDTIAMQNPLSPRSWYLGRPGLARDSDEWIPIDLGDAFDSTPEGGLVDDRYCKTHHLLKKADGTRFVVVISWATMDREQITLTDGGFTAVTSWHWKPEDDAYYFHVTGGGQPRVMRYDIPTGDWRLIAYASVTGAVGHGLIKTGPFIYIFYSASVTRINVIDGEVVTGIPLTDFCNEIDLDYFTGGVRCIGVGRSRHRFCGITVLRAEGDTSRWRVTCWHEPRLEGDTFGLQVPYRRFVVTRAKAGRYIPKPGWPEDPPIGDVVWITSEDIDSTRTVDDAMALGADYLTTDGSVKTGVQAPIVSLGTNLKVYSWDAVHAGAVESRRFVFVQETSEGLIWWFTVKGALTKGLRDFEHTVIVETYNGGYTIAAFGDKFITLTDPDRSALDQWYVGHFHFGELQDAKTGSLLNMRIATYDASSGVTFIERDARFGSFEQGLIGPRTGTIQIVGPRWGLRQWIITTPHQVPGLDSVDGAVIPTPDRTIEGRFVGYGWTVAADLFEIQDALLDRPDADTVVPITYHGTIDELAGRLYYSCYAYEPEPPGHAGQWPVGDEACQWTTGVDPGDGTLINLPFVAGAALTQYEVSDAPVPDRFLQIIAKTGDQPTDIMAEWTDHNFPFGGTDDPRCDSQEEIDGSRGYDCLIRRDVYGTDATGAHYVIASGANVASWDGYRMGIVREGKAKTVPISVGPNAWRHEWFQGRTTPGAIRFDYLSNSRYGRGVATSAIVVANHLSLHGYSLEMVMVDGEPIRRYLWNYIITDSSSLTEADEECLGPALGIPLSPDGTYSLAFQTPGSQGGIHFDASNIRPGSFTLANNSPRATVNRITAKFWNGLDQRDDKQTVNDEVDQASRGIRSKDITLTCVTDPRRVHFILRQMLESPKPDRQAVSFDTSANFGMLIEAGDVITIDHPRGLFYRKAFRVVVCQEQGQDLHIEADAVSAHSVDDRAIVGIRDGSESAETPGFDSFSSGAQRGRSLELFTGLPLMPFRGAAFIRRSGEMVVVGHRPPGSQMVAAVRARVTRPAVSAGNDDVPVVTPRSMALLRAFDGPEGVNIPVGGVIEPQQLVSMPAEGYVVKRLTGRAESVQVSEVEITGLRKANAGDGLVSFRRRDRDDDAVFEYDNAAPDVVYLCTESTADEDSALEPVQYAGEPVPPRLWRNPGTWLDVSSAMQSGTGVATFRKNKDFLVIGIRAGQWLPNALYFQLFYPGIDQRPVLEYSCDFDQRTALGVWKPLTFLDETQGFRQSGRIYIEPPADWSASGRWDTHGNVVGAGALHSPSMFWIRIQRRQKLTGQPSIARLRIENLPLLYAIPPAPTAVDPRELTQGEDLIVRFSSRSALPEIDADRQPGMTVKSGGGRWNIQRIGDVELTAPCGKQLQHGGAVSASQNATFTFRWSYSSASHGFAGQAFDETVMGVAEDPRIRGVSVTVRREQDGEIMRTETVPAPLNEWSYSASSRTADLAAASVGPYGLSTVAIDFRQYDDRGFMGPPFTIVLEVPVYGARS